MTPAARALLAEADRRARLIAWARTEEMRRALARRICFDLVTALRARSHPTTNHRRPECPPDPSLTC